jgi:hypothetical protein
MAEQEPTLPPPTREALETFNYRKPSVEFTLERRMRFLFELRRTGLMYLAASLAGVSTSSVNTARKDDRAFDEAVKEAKNRYVDEVLIVAATKRAVEGVQRPMLGGKFRDEIICYETVYSDGLLQMLIKGQRPEYRDSGGGDAGKYAQDGGGVVIVPSAPATPEEWEAQCGEMANPKA